MPKLNGIELLRYIRSEETLRSVPVVMMSSYDAGDVVCACEESGAEEYLVKPVTQKEVANIWQHVLKKREEATVVPQSAGVDDVCKKDASVAEVETSELEHEHKQRAEEERRRRQQVENRKIMESLREQSTITGEFLRMMRDKRMREFEMLKGQVMLLQEDCEAVSHLSEWDEEEDADGHGHGATRKRKAGLGEESLSADKELIDFSWLNTRGLDASYFAKIHRSAPQLCKGLRGDKPTYNADTKEKSGALHLTPSTEEHLRDFAMSLNAVSQRSKLVVESTIRSGNMANPQEMVCYADFDADDSHFATVSVSRSVKVFDYASIIDCPESLQFPIWQATTRSKLSSVSWNAYLRSHLITSDYDGAIQLWDVASGLKSELAQFEEHEKRVWSIDFSRLDPMQFASASDDATVKIWSLQQSNTSVSSINLPANACSVHYNPRRATMLSVACANHACYVFDTRKSDSPLALLGGATRAVSYIKHLDGDTVLGASTDNAIRSWDLRKMGETSVDGTDNGSWRMPLQPEEVYTGHLNERNFVGLTVDNDGYIASGSEDNSVVIYYYKFPFEVCRYDLGKDTGKTKESGQEQIQDREPKRDKTKAFTSSVCWARGGKSLLVGNSEGCLALLRLQ
jgi:E3 ubiquitin-protein ligase RFWD2